MDARESPHLSAFEQALDGWTDERFVSRTQVRALSMFSQYLVNLAESDGWAYDGHSFRTGVPMCCLTVKGTVDDIPSVVFTSARTYTGCVVTFMRKLEHDLLEWVKDRYR